MKKPAIKAQSTYWDILKKQVIKGTMSKEEANKSFKKYATYKDTFLKSGILKLEEKDREDY